MDRARTTRWLLAATLAAGLFAALIGSRVAGERATLWLDYGLTPLAAAIACVACRRASARTTGRLRAFWALLGCATAAWTAGELVWGYDVLLRPGAVVPVPTWADVGYLAAIPLTVAALAVHPATTASATRRTRWLLDGLMAATALLFLSWTLVLGPAWGGSDLGTWAGVVSLAYPFGDVVIVFFIVLAIRGIGPGERGSLWWLLGGLYVMAIADSAAFAYLADDDYTTPGLIDAGWFVAYLAIALAAYGARDHPVTVTAEDASPTLASLVVPLLLALLTLSVAAAEIRVGRPLDEVSQVTAVALIVLVLVRQALMVGEVLAPGPADPATLRRRVRSAALGGPLLPTATGSGEG